MAQRKCALGSEPFDEHPIAKRKCASLIARAGAVGLTNTFIFVSFSEISLKRVIGFEPTLSFANRKRSVLTVYCSLQASVAGVQHTRLCACARP